MSDPRVSIVLMAAGSSRRLGRPKQLLELGGEPLVRHSVRNAMAANAHQVIVVLGNRSGEIADAIGDLGQQTVVNDRFAEGQSTSLVAGLRAADDTADAVIFMLGDQPTIDGDLLNRLISRFGETGATIVQPVYADGAPGNPVLIGRALFSELLQLSGDVGARDVIRAHRTEIDRLVIDLPQPLDVDTDDDYAALQQFWKTRPGAISSE